MNPKGNTKKVSLLQNNRFYLLLMVLATLLMSVGYATVNSVSLDLTGESSIKSKPGIYVYNAVASQGTNGTDPNNTKITMLYNDVMKSMVVLGNNTNSTLQMTITIYNTLNYDTIFTGITYSENFYDNNNITYELNGISVGTVLPANSNTSFTMTFKYTGSDTSDNILNSYLKFNFKKFYTITYQNINTTNKDYPTYFLDEETTKSFTFTGDVPYDINITPTVNYTYTNGTLTLNNIKNNIIINRYYSITYNLDGGTNPSNPPDKYLHGQSVTLPTPTKQDYTFDGWYKNSSFTGNAITSTSGQSENLTLYAKWSSQTSAMSVADLVEGDTVIYEDANGNDITCKVLYDSNSQYGIQIIAMNVVEQFELGNGTGSTTAVYNTSSNSGTTKFQTAITSRNESRQNLNNASRAYINPDLSPTDGARVVGSPPDNPDVYNNMLTSTQYTYVNNYNCREGDTYQTTDVNQMTTLNIININADYWLGALYTAKVGNRTTNIGNRYLRASSGNVTYIAYIVLNTTTSSSTSKSYSYGLRPVFILKNDIYAIPENNAYRLSATAN